MEKSMQLWIERMSIKKLKEKKDILLKNKKKIDFIPISIKNITSLPKDKILRKIENSLEKKFLQTINNLMNKTSIMEIEKQIKPTQVFKNENSNKEENKITNNFSLTLKKNEKFVNFEIEKNSNFQQTSTIEKTISTQIIDEEKVKMSDIIIKESNKIQIRKEFVNSLITLFKSEENIFQDKKLEKIEKYFLYYIINRKMKIKRGIFKNDIKNEEIQSLKKKFFINKSSKRFEECLKFTLKFFFNVKKYEIFGNNFTNKHDEEYLYNYYFKKTANSLNLPLYEFKDPTRNRQKHKKRKIHNFSKKYLFLIKKSKKFLEDFKKFLKTDLTRLYLDLIKKKIFNVVKIIFLIFEKKQNLIKSDNKNDFLLFHKTLYEYLIKNHQCKLPWTLNEVKDAIFKIMILL